MQLLFYEELILARLSRVALKMLGVLLFWGTMKAFFWQSLKQAKSSGGIG